MIMQNNGESEDRLRVAITNPVISMHLMQIVPSNLYYKLDYRYVAAVTVALYTDS